MSIVALRYMRTPLHTQHPKSVELCGDERKNFRRLSLKKDGCDIGVIIRSTQSVNAKKQRENPTDPIMIVVRFSNRCELLTLEIHFLESV